MSWMGSTRQSLVRLLRTRRKAVVGALTVLAVGAGGFHAYVKLVEHGYLRYNRWDRRVRGTLRAGHQAPDLELTSYAGEPLRLSTLWEARPVVLVFGSCT